MASKPTQRTLKALRDLGATCAIVERWNQFAKVRQDLFGFADILAILGPNLIALQTTSGDNHASRRTKILAEPMALAWLKTGNMIEIHSWSKKGPRGKAKKWVCRREEIVESDFGQFPSFDNPVKMSKKKLLAKMRKAAESTTFTPPIEVKS